MTGGEILITGSTGQAGIALCRLAWPEDTGLWNSKPGRVRPDKSR